MSFGKRFVRLSTTWVTTAVVLTTASPAAIAAVPMPDPVARVPVVGLLPRWTWDPLRAHPPVADVTVDTEIDRAVAFVRDLLAEEYPKGVEVVAAYHLDDDDLVAVQITSPSGAEASFTVQLLDPNSEPAARLAREPG